MASVGHIRSIPKKGLNIDIKNGFEPTYEISADKKDVVKGIKGGSQRSRDYLFATDDDREGSSIASSIYEILDKSDQKKCLRVSFNEITKSAIIKAIAAGTTIDKHCRFD